MARLPKLDHIKYVKRGSKVYAYFNTGQKKNERAIYARLPDPSAPDFFAKYAAFKAGRTKRAKSAFTTSVLIDEFLSSTEFASKAKATQSLYSIQLAKADKLIGKAPVNDVTREAVQMILDGEGWNPGSHNAFISALAAAFAWGRRRGKTVAEPTKDIQKRKGGEHEPWPENVLDAALASESDRVRLAVHLLYFTGQRIGDICALRWSDVSGGRINLTQEKGGREVSFPMHSQLSAELERTPKRGITVLTRADGRRLATKELRADLMAFVATFGLRRVPHGLRKNAVNTLLEAGCTHHETAAITGQSIQMVEHYARRVDRKKLGSVAMLKFEATRRGSS